MQTSRAIANTNTLAVKEARITALIGSPDQLSSWPKAVHEKLAYQTQSFTAAASTLCMAHSAYVVQLRMETEPKM